MADPNGRVVYDVGLRPLACLDCRIESHWESGSLSLVSVVCCLCDGPIPRPGQSYRVWCV